MLSVNEIMEKVGLCLLTKDKKYKYYFYENDNIELNIKLSNNTFGYYKVYFDFLIKSKNISKKYFKYVDTNNLYFNWFIYDIFNSILIYSYLISENYELNIKNILPEPNYYAYLTFSKENLSINYVSIENRLFESSKSRNENDYNQNIKINIHNYITNHSSNIWFNYELIKLYLSNENNLINHNINIEKLSFFNLKISEDIQSLDTLDLSIGMRLELSQQKISDYKIHKFEINLAYSKNHYAENNKLNVYILLNNITNTNYFVCNIEGFEECLNLKNPNNEIVEKALILLKEQFYKKF